MGTSPGAAPWNHMKLETKLEYTLSPDLMVSSDAARSTKRELLGKFLDGLRALEAELGSTEEQFRSLVLSLVPGGSHGPVPGGNQQS